MKADWLKNGCEVVVVISSQSARSISFTFLVLVATDAVSGMAGGGICIQIGIIAY